MAADDQQVSLEVAEWITEADSASKMTAKPGRNRRLPAAHLHRRVIALLDFAGTAQNLDDLSDHRTADAVLGCVLRRVSAMIQSGVAFRSGELAQRWTLLQDIYADPRFIALAGRFPARFGAFLTESGGQDPNSGPLVDGAASLATRLAGKTPAATRSIVDSPQFAAPVVICGFPHSGTRLLAKLLQAAGVFMNNASPGAEWNYIKAINSIIQPDWMNAEAVSQLDAEKAPAVIDPERIAARLEAIGYSGDAPWGQKDPRNCTTADAWLKAFPDARIINIVRNPLDVIGTLPDWYSRYSPDQARPQDAVEHWAGLWNAVLARARRSLARARWSIEVRYEDLCADPEGTMTRIAHQLDIPAAEDAAFIREIRIDRSRDGAHLQWLEQGKLRPAQADILRLSAAAEGYD